MFLRSWSPSDVGSRKHVRTTEVSPPVKNNTDRMNQPVRKTFRIWWRSVWWVIPDMYRDHRHLIACQKQYRQNEPAGWIEVPTGVDVCVTADPRHIQWLQTSSLLTKKTQTEWTSWLGRCSYQGGGLCDGVFQTHVLTTDVSPPVKRNTDRMNQLVG